MTAAARGHIAGFWIRAVADAIDAALLAAAAILLAAMLPRPVLALGEQGAFLGITLALAYHGVLHSRLGGGRTIGKRLLKLRVVRPDGSLLSLDRSLLRYAVLAGLFYGGPLAAAMGAFIPAGGEQWLAPVWAGLAFATFVGCVLLVPFHPLKRGLHDLCADSIVVCHGMPDREELVRKLAPTREMGILVVLALVALAVSAAGFVLVGTSTTLSRLRNFSVDASRAGLAGASASEITSWTGQGERRVIEIEGFVREGELDTRRAALHEAIVTAIKRRVAPGEVAAVRTKLRSGVNLGLYTRHSFVEDETLLP